MSDKIYSRRDFLKTAAYGLGALFIPQLPIDRNSGGLGQVDTPIDFDKYLNLRSNHVLEPSILAPEPLLIVGETSIGNLRQYYGQYPRIPIEKYSVFAQEKHDVTGLGGIGSSGQARLINKITFDQMFEKHIHFAVTDVINDYDFSTDEYRWSDSRYRAGSFLEFFVKSASAYGLSRMAIDKGLDRKLVPTAFVGAQTKFILDFIDSLYRDTTGLQKFFNKIPSEIYEGLVEVRNLNMLINTLNIKSMIDDNAELQDVLDPMSKSNGKMVFFAGSGHIGIKSLTNRSMDELQILIYKNVVSDIRLGLDVAVTNHEGLKVGDKKVDRLDFWSYLVNNYSFPVATFYDSEIYKNLDLKIQDSPRMVLWKELIRGYRNSSSPDLKKKYGILIEKMASIDITHFNKGERNPPPLSAMYEKMVRAYKNNEIYDVYELSSCSSSLVDVGLKPVLIFFEGTPFVIDLNELSK